MLRHPDGFTLLIAALLALAGSMPAGAQTPVPLPSRITFQADALRHPKGEPRALWLARLAAEGRRPVRLLWLSAEQQAARPADPFARLSLDVKGTPTMLPLHVAEPERWTRMMESLTAGSTCPCTSWGAIPGRVPDGRVVLGSLLRVGKSGANVALSWGASCSDDATDYTVHRGTIGTWYSHSAVACSTGGVTGTTLAPGAGSSYFLVVPVTDDAEGSYGRNRAGVERPTSAATCRTQWVAQQCQ